MTTGFNLHRRIEEVGADAGAESVALAFYDYRSRTAWGYRADQWFHAASTMKVPVLIGVFDAIAGGELELDSLVHVRNRFLGVVDGQPYRIDLSRDANQEVHAAVGDMMRVRELARHMIVTSSNLATNVLVDLVGLDRIGATLDRLRLRGIELCRGVEDLQAWEEGINNQVTAQGLLDALKVIQDQEDFTPELSREMLDILHAQEFRSGIPAGLPDDAKVAHKTGEISTVAHDAGIVYPAGREPYVLVILTEWASSASGRRETIARLSSLVYRALTEEPEEPEEPEESGEAEASA